ncbi:glycosyltransferase family 5 protein [Micromonas commoda]|uniref:starch synthase n=1 Tax=Micromonas commoda (strain RCC299 / NOUM17 / CCMP2709) TaxID=296587 RepID=C1FFB9_MICCC|nr:glycosyltransferase family 5 protein [Micromonas commoda]ACO69343.1 glycosyltransferase family 5 protein [Micromonas commoda]|eukprot:XP_002508085.1 glycosyltransferase family 5 protein [Micromonas commoda]
MQPLAHDHPARVEYWLDSGGGDWWIADPIYIHPEAKVLDFVFSNGEGQYDNAGGRDYHAPVGLEDGTLPPEEDHVAKREELLEEEQGPLDATAAHRAGQRAERKFLARSSFAPRPPEDPATAKVVTVPAIPVAGKPVDVFYRLDRSDPKCPLRTNDVFIQGSWNRWTHSDGFGPTQMFPADPSMLPGGPNAKPAYTAKIFVPKNAHVMDFYFKDTQANGQGNYDSKYGLDYHVNITGAAGGGDPIMRVVNIAVEMAPIAKVGGMGDVVTALSRAIIEKGHNVEVILPKYDCMDHEQIDGLHLADEFTCNGVEINVWKGDVEDVPVTFLQPENGHFDVGCIYGRGDDHIRFNFFCECALEWLKVTDAKVDVVHCHDWSSAPAIFARRSRLPAGCATVFTIHNLNFGQDLIGRAMERATFATTVSPTYASEIADQGAIRVHKEKLVGVRNGIDIEIWDPMTDECLEQNYNADSWKNGKAVAKRQLAERLKMAMPPADHSVPLVGVVARLTHQKGVHMIKHAMYRTVENGGQVVLLGSAPDGNVQREFNQMAEDIGNRFPGQSGFVFAYDEPLSHLIYAASDILLVPSMFEPCGLTQMIAMRYGCIPVVRRTGGLRDTVFDVDDDRERAAEQGLTPNGFSFDGSQHYDIEYALDRAMRMYASEKTNWDTLVGTTMRQDWGWTDPADTYVEHYWKATKSAKYQAAQGLHRD